MFFILGISISVFLEFLLLIKKNKSRADKILLVWLLLIVVHQLTNYYLYTKELYNHPHLLGVDFSFPIFHGIFLYFYVIEITRNRLKRIWFALLHLIPPILLYFLAIPFYKLSGEQKIWLFENEGVGFEWFVITMNALIVVSGLFYSAWALLLIKKHRFNIQQNFSNTDKKELQWLKFLSIGFGVIWILAIFFEHTIIFSGVVLLILFIGFFGINQLSIFSPNQQLQPELEKANSEQGIESGNVEGNLTTSSKKRYAKSGLSMEAAEKIYSELSRMMIEKSLYKKDNLSLTELAKLLSVHPNHLSQVINEREQKNFYNYINSYRIKEFIKLANLPENKNFTLLSLAFDCGFSSKSTFNKHFKENTGKTPSEFFNS